MAGGTSVVLVEGGTVSLHSTLFSNVFVPDPAALVQAELPGSAARLQNVTLQAVTAAHPFRVGGDGSIYSDANITVYDDTAQTDTAARSFADIPDERLFLATGDEWFIQLQRVRRRQSRARAVHARPWPFCQHSTAQHSTLWYEPAAGATMLDRTARRA